VGASVLFVGYAAGLLTAGYGTGPLWIVGVLCAVAIYTERNSVRISSTTVVSNSLMPALLAATLFGPIAGMLVAAAPNAVDLWSRTDRRFLKWLTYSATRGIAGGTAGLAAMHAQQAIASEVGGIALATTLAAILLEGLDVFFAAVTRRVRGNGAMWDIVRGIGPMTLVSIQMYAPLAGLLVLVYREVSPWTLPLFLVPALAAQRLYALYQAQRDLTADVTSAKQRLERANLSFASALVATLDARDKYTAGHSAAVAIYSRDIAARMGLASAEQRLAHLCGLVHDIGKVGLPPGLLEKTGALTLEERRLMERHAEIGERILSKVEDYAEIARVVRHHHERADGLGYPDGLCKNEIPIISRIISVADAYNAMTSHRPYRDAMPSRVARLRLAQAVESQFDTSVVAAFEAILASATDDYRIGIGESFTFGRAWESSYGFEVAGGDESGLSAGVDAQLLEDVADMNLYRHLANEESFGDAAIRQAFGH
jgi:putative nucleotidyltransferase with HDIG domain